jgi:hypothetical protein
MRFARKGGVTVIILNKLLVSEDVIIGPSSFVALRTLTKGLSNLNIIQMLILLIKIPIEPKNGKNQLITIHEKMNFVKL